MERAAEDRAQVPKWLPQSFIKQDGAPDVAFQGYQYFVFPMDHNEFSRTGVIGNPMTATAEKGEEALERLPITSSPPSTSSARSPRRSSDGVRGPRLSPSVPPALRRPDAQGSAGGRRDRDRAGPRPRRLGRDRPPRPRRARIGGARRAHPRRARAIDGNGAQRIETDWDKRLRQSWTAKEAMAAAGEPRGRQRDGLRRRVLDLPRGGARSPTAASARSPSSPTHRRSPSSCPPIRSTWSWSRARSTSTCG